MRRLCVGLALATGLLACGPQGSGAAEGDPARPPPGTAVIRGTTLEAASRAPLAGVLVSGPEGASAVSDQHGRFVLRGLRVGAAGELGARSRDGLEAKNPLQPLRNEFLEVVLHLRRP